jgi:DNA-directed RNA polymerase subunit N (RpoN/RPB10)
MTCGRVIGHLWELYTRKTKEFNAVLLQNPKAALDPEHLDKMARGKALDDIGLKRECCRTSMLCHIDLTSRLRNRYQDQ